MEAFRVRKSFGWNGWQFAPGPQCDCQCAANQFNCTGKTASDCSCKGSSCHCHCGLSRETYGGDIWFVEPGDSRLEMMIRGRQAVPDSSLPPAIELLKEPRFVRLLTPPVQGEGRRELATASASGGRR